MQSRKMRNRPMAGFTLIEVLVAVIVLSIGLLGFAGLQLSSLRNNNGSYTRAQAVTLSYDMVDRMRANMVGFHCGFYNGSGTTTGSLELETGIKNCSDIEKNVQGIATQDLKEWQDRLASDSEFPDAEGLVTCNPADLAVYPQYVQDQFLSLSCNGSNVHYVVAIKWNEVARDYKASNGNTPPKIMAVATGFRP